MNPLVAVLLFGMTALLDAAWAAWSSAVATRQAGRAATCSLLIYLGGIASVVSYVGDRWYVIPVALGGCTGTYLTVRRSAR